MDSLLFCGNYSVKIELESSVILSYTGTVRRGGDGYFCTFRGGLCERGGETIKKSRQFREYVLKERELIQSFRKV